MICSLLFQVAEQVFFVHTVGDELGEAVNDDLLVLSIGDAKPLIVGRQDLNADLVGVQQLAVQLWQQTTVPT